MAGRTLASDTLFPKSWPRVARAAVLHAISLAATAATVIRGRAFRRGTVRLRAEIERLQNEIALLGEELRVKDARMAALRAPRRPRYTPVHRMAILELRAQCGWSLAETGRRFLVEPNAFLGRTIRAVGERPRYVITDKGSQFWCPALKAWCRQRHIRPRFGAVGKYGSIAVAERFIRSMKNECCRRIVVPMRVARLRVEVSLYCVWYDHHRPHHALNGRTPDEVYFNRAPANEKRRYEPRRRWPRGSGCAAPWAQVKGRRGARLKLTVRYLEGRQHLPVVALQRAA